MGRPDQRRAQQGTPTGGQWETEQRSELHDDGLMVPAHQTIVNPIFSGMERGDRAKAMVEHLTESLTEMDGEKWKDMLAFQSKFRQYSFGNQMLIQLQCPDATRVAACSAWNDAGGTLKKGAKAIWIWAPTKRRATETEIDKLTGEETEKVREWMSFIPVPVYDISDVDGVKMPDDPWGAVRLTGEGSPQMRADLTALLTEDGWTIERRPMDAAGGTTFFDTKTVWINSNMDEAQQDATLAHEVAHIAAGHGDQMEHYHRGEGGKRPDMEVEAESIAYVICDAYGVDKGPYSFGYISGWANGDKDRVRGVADKAISTSSNLLNRIKPPVEIPVNEEARAKRLADQAERAKTKRASTRTTRKPRSTTTRRRTA